MRSTKGSGAFSGSRSEAPGLPSVGRGRDDRERRRRVFERAPSPARDHDGTACSAADCDPATPSLVRAAARRRSSSRHRIQVVKIGADLRRINLVSDVGVRLRLAERAGAPRRRKRSSSVPCSLDSHAGRPQSAGRDAGGPFEYQGGRAGYHQTTMGPTASSGPAAGSSAPVKNHRRVRTKCAPPRRARRCRRRGASDTSVTCAVAEPRHASGSFRATDACISRMPSIWRSMNGLSRSRRARISATPRAIGPLRARGI